MTAFRFNGSIGGAASAVPHLDILEAAASYQGIGWRVMPLSGKVPLPGSRGVYDATTAMADLRGWPDGSNIAIATGATDRGYELVVIDVDHHPAGDGGETLHRLEGQYGRLPDTVSAITGSGGEHLYFRTGESIGSTVGRPGPGLDVRARGGYVVAPPSAHPTTGRRYEWDNHPDDGEVAELPAWVIQRLSSQERESRAMRTQEWVAMARDGLVQGERNVKLTQLVGHLLAKRVNPQLVAELALGWNRGACRPPLRDRTVIYIVDSIAGREAAKWH